MSVLMLSATSRNGREQRRPSCYAIAIKWFKSSSRINQNWYYAVEVVWLHSWMRVRRSKQFPLTILTETLNWRTLLYSRDFSTQKRCLCRWWTQEVPLHHHSRPNLTSMQLLIQWELTDKVTDHLKRCRMRRIQLMLRLLRELRPVHNWNHPRRLVECHLKRKTTSKSLDRRNTLGKDPV